MADQVEALAALTRGQNGRMDPTMLSPEFASRLYNVKIRDGLARTRPSFDGEELPTQGRFQGAFEYRLEGKDYWVVVVSGQVWLYNTGTATWTYVDTFPTTDFDQAYFVQADQYGIVQNGIYDPVENWPIIFHDTVLVDNLETQYLSGASLVAVKDFTGNAGGPSAIRVPIGTAMAFGHGRLYVAVDRYYDDGAASGLPPEWKENLGLRFWVAGDILQLGNVQSILVFTEGYDLNKGLAFSLPAEMGFITSMAFLRNAETGTGLGALVIFARRGASAFAVNTSRNTSWYSEGFGQVLFTTNGSRSPWAVTQVNSDLVYYGDGGLRSLSYSYKQSKSGLASTPLSPEVYNFTRFTNEISHAPFVTCVNVNNYILFTAGGVELDDGSVGFNGVLPWDLANFQVSGESVPPVYVGAWCGKVYHAVVADRTNNAAAVIYRDSVSGNLKYGTFLGSGDEDFVCSVRTAAYVFNAPLNRKKVSHADALFDRVNGTLQIWFKWRYNGDGPWYTSEIRSFSGSGGSTSYFRIPAGEAEDAGFIVQFALEWKGDARLKTALFTAAVTDRFYTDENLCSVGVLGTGSDDEADFGCPEAPGGVT